MKFTPAARLLHLDLPLPRRADLDLLVGENFGPARLVHPDRCDHDPLLFSRSYVRGIGDAS